jgi:hypothetical protein
MLDSSKEYWQVCGKQLLMYFKTSTAIEMS